jgi:hypothetical protein
MRGGDHVVKGFRLEALNSFKESIAAKIRGGKEHRDSGQGFFNRSAFGFLFLCSHNWHFLAAKLSDMTSYFVAAG